MFSVVFINTEGLKVTGRRGLPRRGSRRSARTEPKIIRGITQLGRDVEKSTVEDRPPARSWREEGCTGVPELPPKG